MQRDYYVITTQDRWQRFASWGPWSAERIVVSNRVAYIGDLEFHGPVILTNKRKALRLARRLNKEESPYRRFFVRKLLLGEREGG